MAIVINQARLTCIWVETHVELLNGDNRSAGFLRFLGRESEFCRKFEDLLKGGLKLDSKPPLSLSPPWSDPLRHRFWYCYLDRKPLADLKGKFAWSGLVPLRAKFPFPVEAPGFPGFILTEAFFHPHDLAFVLTFHFEGEFELAKLVSLAYQYRFNEKLPVTWRDEKAADLELNSLAQRSLRELRRLALGSDPEPGKAFDLEPFTVFTVVRGAAPNQVVTDGDEVHGALEALTAWSDTWESDIPRPLNDRRLPTRRLTDVLYASRRGRAFWCPAQFTRTDEKKRSMGCYHRNTVCAALQVESLGGLLRETSDLLGAGRVLPVAHNSCARYAAGILGRLNGAVQSTYRSRSPARQIKDNELVDPVNKVRAWANLPPLS